jgi:hypothetical protein
MQPNKPDPDIAEIFALVEKLEVFQSLGYPKTEKGIAAYVESICLIVQDQMKCNRMDSCRILFTKALVECEKFPVPAVMAQLYHDCRFLPGTEGKIPTEYMQWKLGYVEPIDPHEDPVDRERRKEKERLRTQELALIK